MTWAQITFADTLRIAVTTSFENSGLADVLVPAVKEDIGLDIQLLVVGTGQALRLGAAGDVDAVLVHSRAAENAFITAGHGTHRRDIMYNDFVIIGPIQDPAGISSAINAADAFGMIAGTNAPFVSRGDNSGTHLAEQQIWDDTGQSFESFGQWYRSVGAGMGAALNTASALDAYTLSDRASWLNFRNKRGLVLLFASDPALHNQYALLPVSPAKNDRIRHDLALQFEQWLTSARAEGLINNYKINGQPLFVFNAVTE